MISFSQLGNLGKLGNQMFQYASLKGIAINRGFEFCIPPKNMFGVRDLSVKKSDSNIHTAFDLTKYVKQVSNQNIIKESGFNFDENLFNSCEDDIDLYGYFQSEKYFKNIKDEIKEDFTFHSDVIEDCNQFIKNQIQTDEIISLHIRRGDYLKLQSHHPILPIEYYENALNKLPDIPVIIFSDDVNWCLRQKIFDSERFFVSIENSSEYDMCLMSLCRYHIIANSSFSWWGAWLSNSKEVIAPKVWFGPSLSDKKTDDLYCSHWKIL